MVLIKQIFFFYFSNNFGKIIISGWATTDFVRSVIITSFPSKCEEHCYPYGCGLTWIDWVTSQCSGGDLRLFVFLLEKSRDVGNLSILFCADHTEIIISEVDNEIFREFSLFWNVHFPQKNWILRFLLELNIVNVQLLLRKIIM